MNHKITLLFLSMAVFTNIWATDYYVDPVNGSDNSQGTSVTNAFRSLWKISSASLQPGDNVYLMDGTHKNPGQTLITIDESGTADNRITIQNYEGHEPVLEFDSWTGIDLINGASYITIKGLKIKGARSRISLEDALAQPGSCDSGSGGGANGFYNGTGILAVGPNLKWSNGATTGNEVPSHIIVENCEIFDCTSSGLAFQQADYVTIRNNKIYNNCWYTLYGTSGINLYQFINTDTTKGFHNYITNNLMYGNQLQVPQLPSCKFFDGNGLIVDDFRHLQKSNYKDPDVTFPEYNAKTLISNNIATENGGSGLHFFLSTNCHIYNNTVVNNAFQNDGVNGNAELRVGGCIGFKIKNNIFKGEYTIHNVDRAAGMTYIHNYQSGPKIFEDFADNACEGCIDGELTFLNEDPLSETPYITSFEGILRDAGIAIEEITNDYRYTSRPDDDLMVFDIGAYELKSCLPIIWYADTDGDGFGDENQTLEACTQPEGYIAIAGDQCPEDIESQNSQKWYIDADGDGFGDEDQVIVACSRPDGYIAIGGDLCSEDINKQDPGKCGCGAAEDSCDQKCASPDYNPTTIYSTAGTMVKYEGKVYENKWYTSGQNPSGGGPWKLVGICDGTTTDCSALQEWNSNSTYANSGIKVIYGNNVYSNRWYTKGQNPESNEVWQLEASCNEGIASKTLSTTAPYSVSQNLKVYPTNVSETLYIETSEVIEVVLYAISGKLVQSWKLNSGKNELNLGSKVSGLYLLNINESQSYMIIKK